MYNCWLSGQQLGSATDASTNHRSAADAWNCQPLPMLASCPTWLSWRSWEPRRFISGLLPSRNMLGPAVNHPMTHGLIVVCWPDCKWGWNEDVQTKWMKHNTNYHSGLAEAKPAKHKQLTEGYVGFSVQLALPLCKLALRSARKKMVQNHFVPT